jgi:hypothetical protein
MFGVVGGFLSSLAAAMAVLLIFFIGIALMKSAGGLGWIALLTAVAGVVMLFWSRARKYTALQHEAISEAARAIGCQPEYSYTERAGVLAAFMSARKLLAGPDVKHVSLLGADEIKGANVEWQTSGAVKKDFKLRIDLRRVDIPFLEITMGDEISAYRWLGVVQRMCGEPACSFA